MYNKADEAYKSHRLVLTDWDKVVPALDARNVVLIPFCEVEACEDRIKELTKSENVEVGPDGQKMPSMGMKSLCIPFDQVSYSGYQRLAPEGLSLTSLFYSLKVSLRARRSASCRSAKRSPNPGQCLAAATSHCKAALCSNGESLGGIEAPASKKRHSGE